MSFLCPAHLIVDNTRTLANSALPDAPVEPDRVRTRRHPFTFLSTLFTKPAKQVLHAGPVTGMQPNRQLSECGGQMSR